MEESCKRGHGSQGFNFILYPSSFILSVIRRRLMKIGLFGGTFDPIHWGHLRSAEEVSETFGLDRVYFIPASVPPHKRGQTTTPAQRSTADGASGGGAKSPVQRVDDGNFARWSFLFHRHDPRSSPRQETRAIRFTSSSDSMPFARSAHGRILPISFRCVISSLPRGRAAKRKIRSKAPALP